MWQYILKRILQFIPTLILISLLAFAISVAAPGDPVERLLNAAQQEGAIGSQRMATEKLKAEIRHRLGLDLPLFYFGLGTAADPDTLYRFPDKAHRAALRRLTRQYGNWPYVEKYYHTINAAIDSAAHYAERHKNRLTADEKDRLLRLQFDLRSLQELTDPDLIAHKLKAMTEMVADGNLRPLQPVVERVKAAYEAIGAHAEKWRAYIPRIIWYGTQNQYHVWLFGNQPWFRENTDPAKTRRGVLRGDFGISFRDQQPVIQRIIERFPWSFTLSILSVFFAYLIAIPIGIYSAYRRDSWFDRASSVVLFVLYSLPSFFVGTLLLVIFANPDFLDWFPEGGVQDPAVFDPDWSLWQKIQHWAPFLVLPLITYTYGSFAFLSRQMRVAMLDVINQDFIRTARAKGLSERVVILKHVLRNSLLPIITIFSNIFPMAIGGSIIIETIFSIPGMGLEIYQSILNYDYPMIVAVFTIFGVLTLVGYLFADIMYAVVDPRISYGKK